MTDTERLNWIIERILTSNAMEVLTMLDINDEDLEGPGDVTLGELFREAIDRNAGQPSQW